MCGIVGLFSTEAPVAESVEPAISALRHRGPDGTSVWISDDSRAGLGHALLNIASLDGIQPIASENERYRLVANGEFYDHRRIRQQLEFAGHRFATDTDSEIALHLFEDLGPACLAELRGEFAFVIWDDHTKRVFAARDRFGIKPLHYAATPTRLYLASEPKALFAAGLPAEWDSESVYRQLFGSFQTDRSLFAGVLQIPPGCFLKGGVGNIRIRRYWDIDYPTRDRESTISEAEAILEARRLLEESIHLRRQAAVPVGYLLSGGLDSTAIMSIASTQSNVPVRAFTIAFDGERYDESEKATIAARHSGAMLDVVRVSETDLADNFAESVRFGETIQANAHGTARFLLSRAIQRAGYRAVMAGEGADELFAGYRFLRPAANTNMSGNGHAISIRRFGKLIGPLSAGEKEIAKVSWALARLSRGVHLPPSLLGSYRAGVSMWLSVLDPEFADRHAGRDPYWSLLRKLDWRGQILGRDRVKQLLYLWFHSIFPSYHMAADRMDMAHAVEVRLPFLDHKLVEFAATLPIALLAKDGRNKHLLREAARPFVAPEVYRGAKQPFYAPPSALRAGGRLHDFIQDTLRDPAIADQPFFSPRAVIALLDRSPSLSSSEQTMLDPLVMVVLSLCLLDREVRSTHHQVAPLMNRG